MTHKSSKKPLVHFVGIGGIVMSALARWFMAQNWAVSGSDIVESGITRELKKEGVKVKIGPHKARNLSAGRRASPDMVIYSSAVPKSNPELRAARRLGIKPLSYPEAMGRFTARYETVAVAGSHGKSTTTALVGLMLKKANFEPNIIVGTKLRELDNKNFYAGRHPWLVLEADEWKAAFLNYRPFVSVVTNIDREHLDFYKNLNDLKKTFLKFLSQTKDRGFLVLNRDDKNLYSLRSPISRIAKRPPASASSAGEWRAGKLLSVFWFSVREKEAREIRSIIKIPGEHNVSNALAALTVATKIFGVKKSLALKVVGGYRGAWRRFEYRGEWHIAYSKGQIAKRGRNHKPYAIRSLPVPVYDDYAHHPTEIKATLKAFREKFPKSKIVCVYQPHQAKRLQALFGEFRSAFDDADITLIMPVYEVAGRDKVNVNPRFTSEALVRAIQKKHPKKLVFYLPNPKNLKKALTTLLAAGSRKQKATIVMMGAGNIVNYTDSLLR
ncbi:MAG: UDP-N-acetylmuramate--L-alanine ligase [Candidatus Liptonbacteria bacterium]|nr:UDP-N-acetylmuramate--L-alanine ligase [Candidatus Liptonbacteria bacterium]